MSGSILTNTSSMTALTTLRTISADLEDTQKHISTGLRISEAEDNIAYWGISNNMRTDTSVLDVIKDSLTLTSNKIDQAFAATKEVRKELDQIKKDMAQIKSASNSQSRIDAIKKDIDSSCKSMIKAILNANVDGDDILMANPTEKDTSPGAYLEYVASYHIVGKDVRTETIKLLKRSVCFIGQKADSTPILSRGILKDVLADDTFKFTAGTSDNAINKAIEIVNNTIKATHDAEVALASVKGQIDTQVEFLHKSTDNLTKSVGTLVDADLDAESARLTALQVQQKLAVQSLSIANRSTSHILDLYRS